MEEQIREEEEEEEQMIVEYMDSDEEVKKRKKTQKDRMEQSALVEAEEQQEQSGLVEEEEEQEMTYSPTSVQEWTPAERAPVSTELRFRPTEFPSSRRTQPEPERERCTVLGRYGRSVVLAAPPQELPLHRRFSSSALMVTSAQLQAHLAQRADSIQPGGAGATRRRTEYELKAAVAPWVGNLVIPSSSRGSMAEQLGEQAGSRPLSSTPVFLLLLQAMKVDSGGCLETIRRREADATAAPGPPGLPNAPAWSCLKAPESQTGRLQRRLLRRQLQDLHQHQQQRLDLQPLPAGPPAPPVNYQPAPLHLPPPPPPVVFIPQPPAASFQLLRSATVMPPSPKVIVAYPLAAPPRLPAPPPPPAGFLRPRAGASAGPHTHTGVSWCAFPSSAPPPVSARTLLLPSAASALNTPPPFWDHDYAAAVSAAPPSNANSSPNGRSQLPGEEQPRSRSSGEGLQPAGSAAAVGGKRLRKPSQRAQAFQEAARAKVSRQQGALQTCSGGEEVGNVRFLGRLLPSS